MNRDWKLLADLVSNIKILDDFYNEDIVKGRFQFPLDEKVKSKLKEIKLRDDDTDDRIFYYLDTIKDIWKLILSKAIKCLRYFDKREPFLEIKTKQPTAININALSSYFDKYSEFESVLYGSGKYYRDHVVHVFRVWLLGLDCLLKQGANYLQKIQIGEGEEVNVFEKISVWSIIALTHDLGYPLEKSQEIIEKTRDMMKFFVSNPILSMDLSFTGVQNNMNDYVLRFMSSKMHPYDGCEECYLKIPSGAECAECNKCDHCPIKKQSQEATEDGLKQYVARLQPKYYFKFQKSLEQSQHGIISSIIIYKLLTYFIESDYNINEDYRFEKEDARQFYIRREILRAVASHTCNDIYHMDMLTFSYLLIIADDSQEWGRKRIGELYVRNKVQYNFTGIDISFEKDEQEKELNKCFISEAFSFKADAEEDFKQVARRLYKQANDYIDKFRDGQDTVRRNFEFTKTCTLTYAEEYVFKVQLSICKDKSSKFTITTDIPRGGKSDYYCKDYIEKIYNKPEWIVTENSTDSNCVFEIKNEED